MGLMTNIMGFVFGDGRNFVAETAEVFRPNAEAEARRGADSKAASLQQFAAEFQHPRRALFDRLVDGLNRLPRPMLAMGTIALFGAAMSDPIWFATRMEGLAVVPEPLWWLMGAIVSFYFGARHQAKGQEFQAAIAQVLTRVPHQPQMQKQDPPDTAQNAALADWWATQG
ncbi:MAG: holin family protein [Paracoccaceae bacterium]